MTYYLKTAAVAFAVVALIALTTPGQLAVAQITSFAGGGCVGTTQVCRSLNIDSDGNLQVEVTGGSGGTVAATQSGTWTVQPGNTPNTTAWLTQDSIGAYDTLASFTTNGLFILQDTTTNQVTATTTLMQSAVLDNSTTSTVYCQIMDGNGRYFLGPTFEIPAKGQYVYGFPMLMTGGINVSCNTSNAVTVGFWGMQ